jgi:hypothetical protein
MDRIDTMTKTTMTTIETEGIHHWLSQLFGLKKTRCEILVGLWQHACSAADEDTKRRLNFQEP